VTYQTAPIGLVFEVANGATPKSGNSNFWDGDVPWITPADLGKVSGPKISKGSRYISRAGLASCGTQIVPSGTIVLSIRAPIGHTAIADTKLCFNQGCRGLIPSKKVCSEFAYWAILSCKSLLQSAGQGTTFLELGRAKLRATKIPLPDLDAQSRIADFLDRETARIDLLIEKKQRLVATVAPRFQALIHAANESAIWQRFGFCATYASRPIPSAPEISYTRLGLYNHGRGFFKKNEAPFEELGDSSFFFVREGDLVFSGQFAWEGSVGLVSSDEDGCVVSHRYPVYVGKNGVLSAYLYAYFRTHHGQFLMENCSRGAAGRNRPLNSRILEKEKIPIPSPDLQEAIQKVVYFERSLKDKTNPSITRLKEYRSALITGAVTGQIDVEAYAKSDATERRLDAIE